MRALDAATGKTIWEYTYDASTAGLESVVGRRAALDAIDRRRPPVRGEQPHAALGASTRRRGKLLWSHDVIKEFGAPQDDRGYSPSPIAYRETVIIPAGGTGSR